LISNSLKFSTQNQTLVINIDAVKNDQFYTFSVADNGPGIKEEYHEQVFELLERLQPKSEIEGAGIGLSTCKKLVEMHGGEIWIDPSYDSGVKFKFTIPYEMLYITNKREKQTVSV